MCFCTNSQVFLCENRKMHTGFHLNYVMNFYFYFAKLCSHLLFRPICGTVTIQIYSGYFVPARSVTSVSKHTAGPPACPADLKYSNRIQVIETFLSGGVYSANDISASIGLSRQTVMKSIQFFLRSGLLVSAGKGDSTWAANARSCLPSPRRNTFSASPCGPRSFGCICLPSASS